MTLFPEKRKKAGKSKKSRDIRAFRQENNRQRSVTESLIGEKRYQAVKQDTHQISHREPWVSVVLSVVFRVLRPKPAPGHMTVEEQLSAGALLQYSVMPPAVSGHSSTGEVPPESAQIQLLPIVTIHAVHTF